MAHVVTPDNTARHLTDLQRPPSNYLFKNASVTSADISNSGLPIANNMPSLKQITGQTKSTSYIK